MAQDPSPVDFNQHVKTDTLRSDLKRRSLQSGLITVSAQPLKFGLGIGSTAVLARLLTPADFGLIAMMAPLLALVDSVTNLGLETATVQREQLDHQQASAIFWLSLKINAVVIGFMVLMAPVLAWFYREAELTKITLVMAVGVLGVCLSFQHQSLLKRQMRFGALTAIEIGALIGGTVSAIAAAWLGFGYWALVFQVVVMQLIQSISYWVVCGWRPAKYVKSSKPDSNLRAMLSYGAHLSGFRCLTRVATKLDRILIGYLSGAGALGLYSVAYKWAYFSFEQIYYPLFDVAVSSFSRALHDPDMYRAYCRRGLMPIYAFCMPALAFSFIAARDLILLLLGNQWLEAVGIFRVLVIGVFVGSIYRVTKWLYVSAGQTQRQLRWAFIHTPVLSIAVAVGALWGVYGVAMGYTVANGLLAFPAIAFCLKTSPLSLRDFLGVVSRPAFSSLGAAVVLYLCKLGLPSLGSSILALLVSFTIFSIAYLLFWVVLPGGRQATADVIRNLKELRSQRNQ
ncbi:MAG TPA: lipopolysaccharide biosynthesis protein [Coleofasciculaceae cyanobacterium]